MSRYLSEDRVNHLHGVAREYVIGYRNRKRKPNPEPMMYVNAIELACILDELKQRRRTDGKNGAGKLSHLTKVLMGMEVGASVEMEPMAQSRLTTLRNTARKHMGKPDARWHGETLPNGLTKVTRMMDGSRHIFGKPRNPAIDQLAAMTVGQTIIITCLPGKMYNDIKVKARLLMDFAEANWKCENLANGSIKATRTR
jgi:hypothetical protein